MIDYVFCLRYFVRFDALGHCDIWIMLTRGVVLGQVMEPMGNSDTVDKL